MFITLHTRTYLQTQTQREREHAPEIHRAFQRDLCKMRLETSRAYVKTLTDGQMVCPLFSLILFFVKYRAAFTAWTDVGIVYKTR